MSAAFVSSYSAVLWALDLQASLSRAPWSNDVLEVEAFAPICLPLPDQQEDLSLTALGEGVGVSGGCSAVCTRGPRVKAIVVWGSSKWSLSGPSSRILYEGA